MKSMYVRASVSVLCAAMLAGCGGSGNGSLVLAATVRGLTKPGLVLVSGSQTVTAKAAGTFSFPNLIEEDSTIDVKVQTQPPGAVCTVDTTTVGVKANYYTSQQIVVNCVTNTYFLSGTVSGVVTDGLVLNNGAMTAAVPAGATSFKFDSKVADGATYAVTVLQQPAGYVCAVANNVGTMPAGDVSNVAVTCTKS